VHELRMSGPGVYRAGTTSSVKDVNEPVLLFLTVSEIFNVHLPRVLLPS
jgi:hypothetical protein